MDIVQLPRLDKDKAYIWHSLYLPKIHVADTAIKNNLTFWQDSWTANKGKNKKKPDKQVMWSETKDHIICPREYITEDRFKIFKFPFIDITPKEYEFVDFRIVNGTYPRDDTQINAFEAYKKATGGVLQLATGKGKSALTLFKIADLKAPVIIICHQGFIFKQWIDEIKLFLGIKEEDIGIIHQKTFIWDKSIVVASAQTLAARVKDGNIPPGFSRKFKAVFYDEVHHYSAETFCTTIPLFLGNRYGLTATAERTDKSEYIYQFNIGKVFYKDLKPDIIPETFFQKTPVIVHNEDDITDKSGNKNTRKTLSFLGTDPQSILFRAWYLNEILGKNKERKALAISASKDQLITLNKIFTDSGIIISETKIDDRVPTLNRSRLTFCIEELGLEALNHKGLDTLFLLSPTSNENDFTQAYGRVQRLDPNNPNKKPLVFIFDDVQIASMHSWCERIKFKLRDKKMAYSNLEIPEEYIKYIIGFGKNNEQIESVNYTI